MSKRFVSVTRDPETGQITKGVAAGLSPAEALKCVETIPYEQYLRDRPDGHGRPASCGEVVSVNAGVGATQVDEGNRMMQENNVDAHFDHEGTMHANGRQQYLKALHVRGLHNMDEIRGGR